MSELVCVMGVSAAGKTTVGTALARVLGVPFVDADALHPESNRAKMASGTPLTDEDRWPWLDAVGASLAAHRERGAVMACSALRRVYRDRIRAAAPGVVFVHLTGSRELLASRAAARTGHFMPPELLDSQLATLEPLEPDERGQQADVSLPVDDLIAAIVAGLRTVDSGSEF
ncbi:MAG: gluconokinase [Cryobacterium sp.]|nr:gluconokinase [Cryobacterium sp.]